MRKLSFLDRVVEEGLKFDSDIEYDLDELKDKLKGILDELNGEETCINIPTVKKKSYFKCPKCEEFNMNFENVDDMVEHLKVYHNDIFEYGVNYYNA